MTDGKVSGPDGAEQDLGELKLEIVCPCGCEVLVFDQGMLHRDPMCADFESREPVEYLQWIRKRVEKTRAQGGS